ERVVRPELSVDPGVGIGESPGGYSRAIGSFDARCGYTLEYLFLKTELVRHGTRHASDAYVEFADVDREAQVAKALEVGNELGFARYEAGVEMCLKADFVDGDALRHHALHQLEHGIRL